jgi:DNA polymerase-1
MLIGEAPGHREDETGKPFVGRAGQLLDEMLESVGLDREQIFITNAVSCRPPANRTPRSSEIKACRYWLDYQLEEVRPRFVGLLGNIALEAVLSVKGIRKLRGRAIEKNGTVYLPMFHPSFILRSEGTDAEDELRHIAEQDLRYFKEMIDFGGVPEERALKSTIVNSWDQVEQMLEAMTGSVSCDIETTALYPWNKGAAVVVMGFGTEAGEFTVPLHHKDSLWTDSDIDHIIREVTEKLEDCFTVFHNGKFDCLWMRVMYGVQWRNDFDTMLAHYLIDENSYHALDILAEKFLRASNWDISLEDKQGAAGIDRLAKYHAHDVYYTRKLYFLLRKKLAEDVQIKRVFDKLLMPCANLFVEMEERGLFIDRDRMDEVEKFLKKEMRLSLERLAKWGDINWASPKQVAELLYGKLGVKCLMRTKKGAESTSESALKMLEHPCVKDLLTYRGHKQQLSFFIEGWGPYLDGRSLHPSFKLHGTVTGRLSSEHPNCQQIPRDTLIRSLVTAPKGWTLVEADLSQIELRIIAELSRDPEMMAAFRNGLDIHWLTALRELERGVGKKELVLKTAKALCGNQRDLRYGEAIEILLNAGADAAIALDKDWKEVRKKAKAIGFGYCFGMGWKKFLVYARDNYDMELSDREAQDSRAFFFQTYQIEEWHRRQQSFAHREGYVRSYAGRKRRLPYAMLDEDTYERGEALRQAINSPVQSFASDINLMILLQLREEFPHDVLQPVATVHDSILMQVRDDYVERVANRVMEISRGPQLFEDFDIKLTVPLSGEVKIGAWGVGVPLKEWRT